MCRFLRNYGISVVPDVPNVAPIGPRPESVVIDEGRADLTGGRVSERLVGDCLSRTEGSSAVFSIASDYRACLGQKQELTRVWGETKRFSDVVGGA
jgi:hypothetical protein